jgi:cytochrome P450
MTSVQKITGTPTGMSLIELQETCSSLMLGGSETTASALSGTVYHLLRNPPVLERLVEETRAAFAKEGDIDYVGVNNLKYQKAVLQEAMRVFPPCKSTEAVRERR